MRATSSRNTHTQDQDGGGGPSALVGQRTYDPAADGSLIVHGSGRVPIVASIVRQLRDTGADVTVVEAARPPGRYMTPVQEAEAALQQARTRHRRHVVVIDGYDQVPATYPVLHALVRGVVSAPRQDTCSVVLVADDPHSPNTLSVRQQCTVVEAPGEDALRWQRPGQVVAR